MKAKEILYNLSPEDQLLDARMTDNVSIVRDNVIITNGLKAHFKIQEKILRVEGKPVQYQDTGNMTSSPYALVMDLNTDTVKFLGRDDQLIRTKIIK